MPYKHSYHPCHEEIKLTKYHKSTMKLNHPFHLIMKLDTSEMTIVVLAAVTVVSLWFLFLFLKKDSRNLPNGSLGLPIFGESLSFLRARKADLGAEWIYERVSKYGPVFKTSLMGYPTVIITGQEGNKFVLGSDTDVLPAMQPKPIRQISGKHQLFELTGTRYKFVKGAMVSFLKPESLQHYVNHMDEIVNTHLLKETKDKDVITFVPMMKKLTFDIACTILFGIHDDLTKDALLKDFTLAFKAIWCIPVNFPGTTFRQGILARSRIIKRMLPIINKKREDLKKGYINPRNDVLSCFLALKEEDQEPVTEIEILDNFIMLMIASHDTSAILLSLIIWKLSMDPKIHEKVRKEQMRILCERQEGKGQLTWNHIQKMKYTWRVAQEMMRIIPPVFGSFRKASKDINFGRYDIPKGWQVFWVACVTHMNKDIFEDPTTFDPSRFETPAKPIPPYAYIPFGAGTHMCIGNEFGRVETLCVVHNLITKFEWSMVNPNETITRQPMPYPSLGLQLKIKLTTR